MLHGDTEVSVELFKQPENRVGRKWVSSDCVSPAATLPW